MLSAALGPCDDRARMRGIVLALLVATGCNYVFGLDKPVHAWDAAPDSIDAPPPAKSFLLLGIMRPDTCSIDPTCPAPCTQSGTGCMPPSIDYEAIGADTVRPELPTIFIGPLFATGDGTTPSPLGALSADPTPYDVGMGTFDVPLTLVAAPLRVVYTLPGDSTSHEVQWSLGSSHQGKLVIPSTTRFGAPPVPTGSSYAIMPTGAPQMAFAHVLTTGVFTRGMASPSGTGITYPFANAMPLYGPKGAPQASQGDLVVVVRDLTMLHGSQPPEASINGWAVTSLDLVAGTASTPTPEPAWHDAPIVNPTVDFNNLTNNGRLTNALGNLYSSSPLSYRWTYGLSPTFQLYGFGEPQAPDYLEQPLVLPIDTLPPSTQPPPNMSFVDLDTTSVPLPRALYAAMTDTRTVSTNCPSGVAGLKLTSGFAGLAPAPLPPGCYGPTPSNCSLSPTFPAALATGIQLAGLDLHTPGDCGSMLTASPNAAALTWSAETGTGVSGADDYEVVLFQVVPGASPSLKTLRTYRVSAPPVQLDGSLLTAGNYYAVEIISHWGFPQAGAADYTVSRAPPFGSSSVFADVFGVQ